MDPTRRYLRHFLRGWVRVVILGVAAATAIRFYLNPQGSTEEFLESSTNIVLILFWSGLLLLGLVMAVVAKSKHPESAHTREVDEVLNPLVTSDEEYCLILRPFGNDGATILRRWARTGYPSPALTLEQGIALAIRQTFGMKTYSLVDQDEEYAPPGPVYLRASHAKWRNSVKVLIGRAHTILLLIPPGQEIREAFAWEIEQITHYNFQTRVIVVLPPWSRDDDGQGYEVARHQTCVILAALEGFAGSIDEADPLKVHHYELELPKIPVLVKLLESENIRDFPIRGVFHFSLHAMDKQRTIPLATYTRGIVKALKLTTSELSELSFNARYPWRFHRDGR